MRPSLRVFGAELIDASRKSEFTLIPKPGKNRVAAAAVAEAPSKPRVFPQRKQYLFGRYTNMLRSSKCVLLFQNNNLTSEELGAIKLGLSGVNKPEGEEGATLEMVRGGLLAGVASRDPSLAPLTSIIAGPMIVLHSASPPSPTYLSALLASINKSTNFKVPASSQPTPFTSAAGLAEDSTSPTAVNPKIFCVGAVVDGEIITADGVRTLGTLPELDTLRAQIVGLISAPASQLSGVLSAAAGGQLSRVLEGLKIKLGAGEEGSKEGKQPSA